MSSGIDPSFNGKFNLKFGPAPPAAAQRDRAVVIRHDSLGDV
jgi:hypothetical protein